MSAIKKTMQEALAFVTPLLNEDDLLTFTNTFCVAKTRAVGTGAPREIVRLYDVYGNTIARRCSAFKVWLLPSDFNGDIEKMSICREANKLKTANLRSAEKLVRDGEEIRLQAKDLTDVEEKLAKFEEYDAILEEAKQLRTQAVSPDGIALTSYDSVESVAQALGVDVITEKPTIETVETAA